MLNKINAYNYGVFPKTNAKTQASNFVMQKQIANSKDFKSLYTPGGVSFTGAELLIQNASKITPQLTHEVGAYRTKLATALGTTVDKLISVLEPNELKQILKKAKPENFSTGENFENVLNGTFNINLHMHTDYSDGTTSVVDRLDQAAQYAYYRKNVLQKTDPVIIGISDHDMLEDARIAIKTIADNPEKYKNIRFASETELNARYASHQVEAIGYCINPFDENLNKLIESGRETNKQYWKSFLTDQVNVWEAKAGIPAEERTTIEKVIAQAELRDVDGGRHIKYFGSPGLTMGFTNALKSIFFERGWKFDGIEKFAYEHNKKYGSYAINPGTPTLAKIAQTVKESSLGFVGIAHPCRNLDGLDLRYVFQDFKNIGIEAAEVNYQYPANNLKFSKAFQEHANLAATQAQMIKTGGGDNHADNIFTNEFSLKNLPEAVQAIFTQSKNKEMQYELLNLPMTA